MIRQAAQLNRPIELPLGHGSPRTDRIARANHATQRTASKPNTPRAGTIWERIPAILDPQTRFWGIS